VYGDFRNKSNDEIDGELVIDELEDDDKSYEEEKENEKLPNDIEKITELERAPIPRISGINRALRNLNNFLTILQRNKQILQVFYQQH
jgi:predicted KAP-like P-loop ATPase